MYILSIRNVCFAALFYLYLSIYIIFSPLSFAVLLLTTIYKHKLQGVYEINVLPVKARMTQRYLGGIQPLFYIIYN